MEEEKKKLELRKEFLQEDILSIQSKLGQKRMFRADGTVLGIAEFTAERQKLKSACVWRMSEMKKINARLKELKSFPANTPQKARTPTVRTQIIGMAFSLLCDDVMSGEAPQLQDSKNIAQLYLDKAAWKMSALGA